MCYMCFLEKHENGLLQIYMLNSRKLHIYYTPKIISTTRKRVFNDQKNGTFNDQKTLVVNACVVKSKFLTTKILSR